MNRYVAILAAGAVLLLAAGAPADDDDDDRGRGKGGLEFEAELSGAQEVTTPAGGVPTPGAGEIEAEFDEALSEVRVSLKIRDLRGTPFAVHFHCARAGQNGPIAFGLVSPGPLSFDDGRVRGTLTNAAFAGADCVPLIGRPVNNIAALAFAMRDGLIYANVHTDLHPGGEIRGQMLED